ncbi:DUF2690 domain-containing protein [Streptomyces sp. NPDC020379]|uniref:DUF2690 domain-containing protein n=1 Tax=Streptomyces sp. NPDC020379 TaxID=3365071 RepID=UPI003795243B
MTILRPVFGRMSAPRVLGTIAVACLSLAATVTVSAPPATAKPGAVCDGVSCNGKDPGQTGCGNDARTVATKQDQNVTLELRYSPSCHANWARIHPGKLGWNFTVYNDNGDKQSFRALGSDSAWTDMVNGYPKSWACFDNGACTPKA